MNVQSGIPLRAEPTALARAQRQSFIRAATAIFLGRKSTGATERIMKGTWGDDGNAQRIMRAAQRPMETGDLDAWELQSIAILPLLAPASAAAKLLGLATQLELTTGLTISIPGITPASLPTVPFLAEGQAAPVVELNTSASILGPTKKLLIIAAISDMLSNASLAEQVISAALSSAAEQSLDKALFDNVAADATRPAGILAGLTPVDASSAGTGVNGIAKVLGLLAEQLAAADDYVVVTTPSLATEIKVLSSPKFTNTVLASKQLAAGTVIAVIPRGLVTAYTGTPQIDVSTQATLHMDTAPTDISTPGAPPVAAAPVKGMLQAQLVALRVRGFAAWCALPGAVSYATGVTI